jgi:hypothetical protein
MIWLLLTTAIISFADLPPGTALPAPDKIKIIQFENRDTRVYGSVEEQENQIKITYDTPWQPQPVQSIARGGVTWESEAPRNRESRLLEEGRIAGFTRIETPQGERWLPIEQVELARRAQAMAEAAQPAAPLDLPEQAVTSAEPAQAPTPASPYRRYAVQAVIAVAGLAVAGLILRFMVFAD